MRSCHVAAWAPAVLFAASLLAAVALAPAARALDAPAQGTVLVTFADGSTVPLRSWMLSYDYVVWRKGDSPLRATASQKETTDFLMGKRALSTLGSRLEIVHGDLRRETLVDGRPQDIVSSAAREVVLTAEGGKPVRAKIEPPHRELLSPGLDKAMFLQVRSLDLTGQTVTGAKRTLCLISYSTLVECAQGPADQVVKVEFQR